MRAAVQRAQPHDAECVCAAVQGVATWAEFADAEAAPAGDAVVLPCSANATAGKLVQPPVTSMAPTSIDADDFMIELP